MARIFRRNRKNRRALGRTAGNRTLRRLHYEPLEDRRLLAQLTVTNLDDSGAGSLRDAIETANADIAADEIVFQNGLGGTIALTSGPLVITRSLTIAGPGAALLTIDAGRNSRVIDVSFGSFDVEISGVTLTGGRATSGDGGAIQSNSGGALSITDSIISGNFSSDDGGGISVVAGPLSVTNSTISGNNANDTGGGIVTRSGQVTITDSTISGNSAGEEGGGISSVFGQVTITASTVSDNSADYGGGISTRYGQVTVTASTISGNSANEGGGIYTDAAPIAATSSTISGNSAEYGGGGIFANSAPLDIHNSTISGNSADQDGGGVLVLDSATNPPLTIHSSIIAGNTAVERGPDVLSDPDSVLTIGYSLIGDNSDTPLNEAQTPDGDGNLVGDAGGLGIIDPQLLALGFNGGATPTHAPRPSSPAINAGAAGDQTTDQRGAPRDDGNGVDMGAFELDLDRVFIVDSTGDGPDNDLGDGLCNDGNSNCTLRAAILQASATGNADPNAPAMIFFDDGVMSSTFTIHPGSALPTIDEAVVIDGTSEPDFPGTPIVEIDGALARTGANGLHLIGTGSAGSAVRGLNINSFDLAAIRFDSDSSGHTISGNMLGLDLDGSTEAANRFGLHISSANNTIEGNVISGNNRGILLNGGGATGNTIRANLIGTNSDGKTSRGNTTDGVKIRGGSGNTIGGPTEADGNTISANFTGVNVLGGSADNNTIQHNLIGTKSTGDGDRGNYVGINLIGTPGTTIKDNVVAGSKRQAIRLTKPDTTGTLIEGNLIGLGKTGTLAIGTKYDGIQISNAPGNTIRGNVIANSGFNGIRLLNAFSTGNTVQSNLIGTALDGTTPMGNLLAGILIKNSPGNQIGGTGPGEGNTISANGEHGILIERAGATGNVIEGNHIGTDEAGTAPLGNASHGIQVDDGVGNMIGGTAASAGNVIGGNLATGIAVTGGSATIQGNFIGTDAGGTLDLGNANDGIIVNGGTGTIGGTAPGAGNVIAHNGLNGVKINSGTGNAIRGNSIHDNAALGIDLKPNGPTDNDAGDPDTGANRLQNSPAIQSIVLNGTNLDITYVVDSTATNADYTDGGLKVEFFIADANSQEGKTFLVDDVYTTAQALAVAVIPAAGVFGQDIVATVTDASGNTSEFSEPFTAPSPLLAAGGEAVSREIRVKSQELDHSELMAIVDAGIQRLAAAGFASDLFANVEFAIADLPGAMLGLATGNTIAIDVNAAGHDWFIDTTPLDDLEFSNRKSQIANQKSMDLLTVVMHELGHSAGLDDIGDEDDLMFELLEVGVRKTSLEASLADSALLSMYDA